MPRQFTQISRSIARYGSAATLKRVTGTACPCMVSRDANKPAYSAEWHRLNPVAAACNGTGLISRTTTSTSILAFFYEAGIAGSEIRKAFDTAEIGELALDDVLAIGALNASTAAFVGMVRDDNITVGSREYKVFHVSELMTGDVNAQWALLKRIV